MAQLSFPITLDGLAVPVWIGLDGLMTDSFRAAGQPIPAPIQACGLLDTGSDTTMVAASLAQRLNIPIALRSSTHTAGGQLKVNLYRVSLGITDPSQPAGSPWLTESDLLVMEAPAVLPNADVLIGLDVLLKCRLLLDGPAKQFTLEF